MLQQMIDVKKPQKKRAEVLQNAEKALLDYNLTKPFRKQKSEEPDLGLLRFCPFPTKRIVQTIKNVPLSFGDMQLNIALSV